MRAETIVLVKLTTRHGGDSIIRIDRIESIEANEHGGSFVNHMSGNVSVVVETPELVRERIVEAYQLAAEAMS